jgi:type II secretory pathway component PulF
VSDNSPGAGEGRAPVLANTLTLVLLCLSMLIILVCLLFVVPRFGEIFKELDVALPLPTKLTLSLAQSAQIYWFILLPIAGLLCAAPLILARRRAWVIHLVVAALALFLAVGGMMSVTVPVVKIQQMINKK